MQSFPLEGFHLPSALKTKPERPVNVRAKFGYISAGITLSTAETSAPWLSFEVA
jgi:hypothetical protein